jgi:hypothetical protein
MKAWLVRRPGFQVGSRLSEDVVQWRQDQFVGVRHALSVRRIQCPARTFYRAHANPYARARIHAFFRIGSLGTYGGSLSSLPRGLLDFIHCNRSYVMGGSTAVLGFCQHGQP